MVTKITELLDIPFRFESKYLEHVAIGLLIFGTINWVVFPCLISTLLWIIDIVLPLMALRYYRNKDAKKIQDGLYQQLEECERLVKQSADSAEKAKIKAYEQVKEIDNNKKVPVEAASLFSIRVGVLALVDHFAVQDAKRVIDVKLLIYNTTVINMSEETFNITLYYLTIALLVVPSAIAIVLSDRVNYLIR